MGDSRTAQLSGPNKTPALATLLQGLDSLEFVLPAPLDLDVRLAEILATAMQATSARFGALLMTEGNGFQPIVTEGDLMVPCMAHLTQADCGVPHFVARTGHTMRVDRLCDVTPSGHYPTPRCAPRAGCGDEVSLLAVPVPKDDGTPVGVLELLGARDATGRPVPFAPEIEPLVRSLAAQAGSAITNAQLTAKLREAQFETVFRLSVAAEFRDTETAAHIQRMSRYTEIIARNLGLEARDVELARFASPMHDVGKLGVPDSILLKPGRLSDDETAVMRSHTIIGARILDGSESALLQASETIALTHHERVDGLGYPLGLKGDKIPLLGRIACLADALDAMTSRRCYKEAVSLEAGMETCRHEAGHHFDPECVQALEKGFTEVSAVHRQFADSARDLEALVRRLRLVS